MSNLKELLMQDLKDYRGLPFWSWNDKLEKENLVRQINQMKEAGIGGFFMHARGGLQTEYLSEDWFSVTKTCIEEAKKLNLNAWCYDENGWPSGFAGMKLLEDSENHVHYLTYEIKDRFDKAALAVYIIENNNILRIYDNSTDIKEYHCIFDKTNSSVVDILNEEDILETLGALFVDCNQAYELRFKYWRLMNKLFVSSFAKQNYEWCEKLNCKLTGHAVEENSLYTQMWCCAGIDWLGREIETEMNLRQVSSVAQQLGRKQVITETFACTGWDITPRELKRIVEYQYVNGVNGTDKRIE